LTLVVDEFTTIGLVESLFDLAEEPLFVFESVLQHFASNGFRIGASLCGERLKTRLVVWC